jgi:small-conductance mechanosensitive channel
MAHEASQSSTLTRAIGDLLGDISDLVQKEIRLARAELTEKVSRRLEASAWFVAAGVLAFVAALLLIEAAVFALASRGLPLHWSCVVVAVAVAAAGAAAFSYGRSSSRESLAPTRSIKQINEDLRTAKEQLS